MPPEAVTSLSLRQLLLESGQTSIRALLLERLQNPCAPGGAAWAGGGR